MPWLDELKRQVNLKGIQYEGCPVEKYLDQEKGKEINFHRCNTVNGQYRIVRGHSRFHSGPGFDRRFKQPKQNGGVITIYTSEGAKEAMNDAAAILKDVVSQEKDFINGLIEEKNYTTIILYGILSWKNISGQIPSGTASFPHAYNDAAYSAYLENVLDIEILMNTIRNNRMIVMEALESMLVTDKRGNVVTIVGKEEFYNTSLDDLSSIVSEYKIARKVIKKEQKNVLKEQSEHKLEVPDMSQLPEELVGRDVLYCGVINNLTDDVKEHIHTITITQQGNLVIRFK